VKKPRDFKRERGGIPLASVTPTFVTSRGTRVSPLIWAGGTSFAQGKDARRLAAWLTEAADWLDEQNKKGKKK
jgi:hypothetical protein